MEKATIKPTPKKVVASEDERWRNSSIRPELMVSSKGRVKSREYKQVIPDAKGGFRIYDVPAKTLETKVSQSGTVTVSFTNAGGNVVVEDVALLVATEFVPNEDPSKYAKLRFRDLNRANLNASNLYWDGVGIYSRT